MTEDRRLSRKTSDAIARAARSEGVWLSAISIWEVATKVEKKQLVLDRPPRQWMDQAPGVSGLLLAEQTRPFFSTAASCRSRSTAILPIS